MQQHLLNSLHSIHDWEAWEKLWHCSALGDILNCTSCDKKAGLMGTPAKDPPEFVCSYWKAHTLVQWILKGRVMCGRSCWWGPFIFLHAIRSMKGPAFHCLVVQTSFRSVQNVWAQQDATWSAKQCAQRQKFILCALVFMSREKSEDKRISIMLLCKF